MLGWLGRFVREEGRRQATPGAPARLNSPPQTATGAVPHDVQASTLVAADGTGVDLLILGTDPLGDDGYYIGDDPIGPDGD